MRVWLFFFIGITTRAFANDSLVMAQLLNRIQQLQPKEDGVFPKGSIPSYRLYALNKDRYKADINPFFTGLVAFTLQDIKRDLSPYQQQQAQTIIQHTYPVYAKFENPSRSHTYNFWSTDQRKIFPHGGWMNWFDRSQSLPDDLDDTVIILMAQQQSDSVAKAIHQLMQSYTNNDKKKITNTFEEYKHIGAYSTWFGKKMPVDFDISVLTNVLYFVQYYDLGWTAADSASLQLIEKVLESRKHIDASARVSPHYNRSPVILYHLSRLMALRPIPSLERFRPQLVEDTRKALLSANTFMDEVILSTALLRWNEVPPVLSPREGSLQELVEDERFSFFIANMSSVLPGPFNRWFSGIGTFYYDSPAYNNTLLLENLVWRKRRGL